MVDEVIVVSYRKPNVVYAATSPNPNSTLNYEPCLSQVYNLTINDNNSIIILNI